MARRSAVLALGRDNYLRDRISRSRLPCPEALAVCILFVVSVLDAIVDMDDDDVCRMPIESGMCLAYMPSWGFDVKEGACARFIYGGCGGNGNRFPSEEACQQACGFGGLANGGTQSNPDALVKY